mmetsp:Transcript_30519/g.66847  ORF Transcript_30519/g.66847 Transcript_30519/m.66847 type:complete len:330 (-) Transcript_30519:222-1211(-)
MQFFARVLAGMSLSATHVFGGGDALVLVQDFAQLMRSQSLLSTDDFTGFGSNFSGGVPVIAATLGYQKCGTTMISDMLRLHPDVVSNAAKELHYLAGPEADVQCKKQGPPTSFFEFFQDCFEGFWPSVGQVLLDFTPTYGTIQHVSTFKQNLRRLKESQAVFRFIAVLREPASRAISAVGMRRKNNEGDYGNLTDSELDERLSTKLRLRQERGASHRFITDGEYATALKDWLKTFSRDSLLVVNNAHLSKVRTWTRIYRHLGLEVPEFSTIRELIANTTAAYKLHQQEKYAKSGTQPYQASPLLIENLRDYYEPYNKQLWKLLGSPAWW